MTCHSPRSAELLFFLSLADIEAVEHITPQSTDASKALDYTNMLAVCDGNEGKGALICDKSRRHIGHTSCFVRIGDIAAGGFQIRQVVELSQIK